MNMDFGLYQQQSMKLVMTNELRQAITILQYSVQELNDYLHDQHLENPLIELKDQQVNEEIERRSMNETTPQYDYRGKNDDDDDYSPMDQLSDQEEGLQDYLLNQIRLLEHPSELRKILTYLALSVDENGYLMQTCSELAAELGEAEETVQEAVRVLQTLEPFGVGAGSLKECLLIQLQHMETRDYLAEAIISNHLDALSQNKFKEIARAENVDSADVQVTADFIQTLNPRPGMLFNYEPAEYVTPDVTVINVHGRLVVSLNEQHLPKMTINRDYEKLMKNKQSDVQQYMKQKFDQYKWIRRSIQQRQQTILKVTEAIVRHQDGFFIHGPSHLKPLTLRAIAEEANVHESTVSRATTRKYVQTPRGLYELKYFFNSATGRDSGESSSSERVKIYMKRLIDEENKRKPLSDQKLADLLRTGHRIQVSRRTVAKYREEMHIPSSSQRKRFS